MLYDLASLSSGAGYGQMSNPNAPRPQMGPAPGALQARFPGMGGPQGPNPGLGQRGPEVGPGVPQIPGSLGPGGPQGSLQNLPPQLLAMLQAQGGAVGANPFSGVGGGRPPVPMGGFSRPLGQMPTVS